MRIKQKMYFVMLHIIAVKKNLFDVLFNQLTDFHFDLIADRVAEQKLDLLQK